MCQPIRAWQLKGKMRHSTLTFLNNLLEGMRRSFTRQPAPRPQHSVAPAARSPWLRPIHEDPGPDLVPLSSGSGSGSGSSEQRSAMSAAQFSERRAQLAQGVPRACCCHAESACR